MAKSKHVCAPHLLPGECLECMSKPVAKATTTKPAWEVAWERECPNSATSLNALAASRNDIEDLKMLQLLRAKREGFIKGYDAHAREQEQVIRGAKHAALEELKEAMVNEMARINQGRGFKNEAEIHGILPEQLRLLSAKYAPEETKSNDPR